MPHEDKIYPYEQLHHYPHLGPTDLKIWDEFIHKNPGRFDEVMYDYRVGEATCDDEDLPKNVRGAWHDLTRWRVDVIANDKRAIHIIEVKPRANAKALGQAVAYTALFIDNARPTLPVVPVVLTDIIIPSTVQAAKAMGVMLWTP